MLVGPDGVGKTSLAQQIVLHRIGVRAHALLSMVVQPAKGRVLYIAADRPRQAASSLRRMVLQSDESALDDRLIVWKGPPDVDIVQSATALREWVDSIGAVSDVVIDSLKDVAPDLSKDEVGSRVNRSFQELVAAGYELLVLHHQRKAQQGGSAPKGLQDVYGSRWLTAGMGSVALLWGAPGDLIVECRHLKQPDGEIGPFNVIHDHNQGTSSVHERPDLVAALACANHGVVVSDAARLRFETSAPSKNQIEKARRILEGMVKKGKATRADDPDGLARYFDPAKAP